ncbi:MAG TPA: thiamine phosphate synthase [Rhodocyclaceae bacterium]|nr:thiamine phosphate synthase [Rhodocyclaceae bacterium]
MTSAEQSIRRGLYLVTPDWDDTVRLLEVTRAAIAGGAVCVQYRHKTASSALRHTQAVQLAELCRQHQTAFIVNDNIELALEVGADGVHIGHEDGDVVSLRARFDRSMLIGVSCYNEFERAQSAIAAGASYVAFGAMYPSTTKPHAVAASLDLIGRAKRELDAIVACIGGITADNAELLVEAGADLLAVITDIYDSADPQMRAAQYSALFDR